MTFLDSAVYHAGVLPRADRFPKRGRHWLRPGLSLVLAVAVIAGGVVGLPWLAPRINCRPGVLPSSTVWRQDGECVGISSAPYDFGVPGFTSVFRRIADQNTAAGRRPCGKSAAPVTIGVVTTMTSTNSVGRSLHELEGFATAQAMANDPLHCRRPIRIRIGQIGAVEQAAGSVTRKLADRTDVVGLIGMGLSDPLTARAVNAVAAGPRPVPMVADLVTAEGFDQDGSAHDDPDFSGCSDPSDYAHGVGRNYFYRVSYRTAVQFRQIENYLSRTAVKADFIVTPSNRNDPSVCSKLGQYEIAFPAARTVRFDSADSTTMDLVVRQICSRRGAVTALYAARGLDLSRFIVAVDQMRQNGVCQPDSITVVVDSDGSRIRAVDPVVAREAFRTSALASRSLAGGYLRLLMTPLANPDLLPAGAGTTFAAFKTTFSTDLGFDSADLDDGWALNAHDALATMAAAVNSIPLGDGGTARAVTPAQVNTAIGTFSPAADGVQSVFGALQGPLIFDNSGNRVGTVPEVVRLCGRPGRPPRTFTVPVTTGTGSCVAAKQ